VVVAIRRDGTLFVPSSGDQLFAGDSCYIFVQKYDVQRALEVFGKAAHVQDRIVIVGGGNVGFSVAKNLENRSSRIRAKVIEKDRFTAEQAAELLEKTIVLHGDGLDADMLSEANIERSDAILAVTDDDKTNLLAAIRAKSMGCPLAICLINDPSMEPLLRAMGIDAHVNPRATTVSSILRHIRHGRVRGVYSIGDAEAEVIEAQVLSTSSIAGQSIRDIEFPEGVLVGAVRKGDKILKPSGALRIDEGDHVVLFALSADVGEVERLLQVTIDFF
jgi:trk system potassium uptake protein TrkA